MSMISGTVMYRNSIGEPIDPESREVMIAYFRDRTEREKQERAGLIASRLWAWLTWSSWATGTLQEFNTPAGGSGDGLDVESYIEMWSAL